MFVITDVICAEPLTSPFGSEPNTCAEPLIVPDGNKLFIWFEPLTKLSPVSLPYLASNSVVNWAEELITPSAFNLVLTLATKLSLTELLAKIEFFWNGVIVVGKLPNP